MAKTKTPTLVDAFAERPDPALKGPRCTVGRVLVSASPADAEVLRQVLNDPAWTNARIAERLRLAGHRTGAHTVTRHRRGECLCASMGIA